MSKTPLFSKERTSPSILIPHVDNKILSFVSQQQPAGPMRAAGGYGSVP